MAEPRPSFLASPSRPKLKLPAGAVPFACKLGAEFGDRCFWGSDWPHPNLAAIPDDGVLVDLLSEVAPSEKARKALLVDNPLVFYRFKR